MKKRKLLQYMIYLLVMASCARTENIPVLEKGKAIITGKISNLGKSSKAIRFSAGSTIKDIEKTAIIDTEGNFRLEIELYHPQNVQGFFKERLMKLYLRPSDSIHLEIDELLFSKEEMPEFGISGTCPDAEISKEMQQYLKYCGKNEFNPDARGKSVKEFLHILQEQVYKQDSILEVFSKAYKVSREFKNWATKDIKYNVANYLINYKFSNKNYEGNLFEESIFPIDDDAAITTSLYPLHLRHYALNAGIWQDSVTLNLLKGRNYTKAYQRCMNVIIDRTEKGLSRDIMCYKLLLGLLSESYKDFGIVTEKLDLYIENETLKTLLEEKENEYKNQKIFDISFLDPAADEEKKITGDFWAMIKEKYHGKVVYVDIWATWCSPCRGEIPYAIELHDCFDGKDIAFVNLCLASSEGEWQKTIKSNNIKGDNYFFNKTQTQMLRNKLQLKGYPTYLIIDKKGNLVNNSAPRPSSGDNVRQLLNDWIGKDTP